jgi:uncharacterized protein YggE
MRSLLLAAALAAAAPQTLAQTSTAAASEAARFDKAPWWMDKPIIASTGYVRTEILANRATFSATYHAVDRDAATATRMAADKVKVLGTALSAYGDKVRVETSFRITPLYEQYRDKDGTLIDNERADKIKTYQVAATVAVEVRDVRLVERVYATALAAKPTDTQQVNFRLEPDNETKTQMFRLAVEDATRRAKLAVEATSSRLGAVRLIDPTGRACETDVLVAGAERGYGGGGDAQAVAAPAPPPNASVEEMVVTSQRRAAEVGLRPEDLQLPLQPPLQRMEAQACVVFAIS